MTGTIKSVKLDKGYGFLRPSGATADVFFHWGQLRGLDFDEQLLELDVEFEVASHEGRDRACNVRPVEDIPQVRRHG